MEKILLQTRRAYRGIRFYAIIIRESRCYGQTCRVLASYVVAAIPAFYSFIPIFAFICLILFPLKTIGTLMANFPTVTAFSFESFRKID